MIQGTPFGLWLRQRREELDLTRQDLAQRVLCSLETIRQIERGKRRPSKQIAELLAECLGVPLDEHSRFVEFARIELNDDQLAQLAHANGYAPWRTLHTVRHPNNLPAPINDFIGRKEEVEAVCALLRRPGVRLLTLTGPPGIGKTRLALQVASQIDDFPDGVLFVPLASITDPALVIPAIARTLHIQEVARWPLIESLQSYLQDKRILLLLDNFEQVVKAAPWVSQLLGAAPQVKALTTSRVALHLYGEHDFQVPALALPATSDFGFGIEDRNPKSVECLTEYAAVRLFIERAQAAKADFEVTVENACAVVEICHRLDGLPLAIELAAARVRLMPTQIMLMRLAATLNSRLELLTGGPKDLPARQQTMRGAIEGSYDLLNEQEKELFRWLSVFVDGCSLEAVETMYGVRGGEGDTDIPQVFRGSAAHSALIQEFGTPHSSSVLEGLSSLLDMSLLKREEGAGDLRYWMLETIREFAFEKLEESGEAEATRRLHANYFLQLAEEAEPKLRGPEQVTWLNRLETEYGNLRAALEWSLASGQVDVGLSISGALWRFWDAHAHYTEGRGRLAALLASPVTVERTVGRAKALSAAGALALVQGETAQARSLLQESLDIFGESGDNADKALAFMHLGDVSRYLGDYMEARPLYEESLAAFQDLGDKWGMASSLGNLGAIATKQGDHALAYSRYEQALEIFREVGDKWRISRLLLSMAVVYFEQVDYTRVRALLRESRGICQELGDKRTLAIVLNYLGELARAEGDYAAALSSYEESLMIGRELGGKLNTAVVLHNLGHVALHQGDAGQAVSLFTESLVLFQKQGDKPRIAWCLAGLAGVSAELRQPERAARLFGAAEGLLESMGARLDPADRIEYERNMAATHAQLGEAMWEIAWEEGRAMSMEQAIAYALQEANDG